MSQFRHLIVDVVVNGRTKRIPGEERTKFAKTFRLDDLIPNRYTEILVVDLMMSLEINGIDPRHIIDEIKRLEALGEGYTKEATQFKHAPLHPLWHQHYFSAHFLVDNIQNELRRKGAWDDIFQKSLGPEGSRITEEQIQKLVHEAVEGTVQKRSDEKRVTGEWLVFSRGSTGNIYLCMASHTTGDHNICSKVAYCCERQFPSLEPFASNRISNGA
jgi:hypothetical protein